MNKPEREPDYICPRGRHFWFKEMLVLLWESNVNTHRIKKLKHGLAFNGTAKLFTKFTSHRNEINAAYKKYIISKSLKEKLCE